MKDERRTKMLLSSAGKSSKGSLLFGFLGDYSGLLTQSEHRPVILAR